MDFLLYSQRIHKSNAAFWITYIMGMFLIYGLNTWLPQMMRQAGYPLGSSLSFLLMLNITAAIGALFAGAIADRIGAKIVISISYLMAAVCIGLLTIKPSVTIIYLLIGLAGIGSVGITQILNAYVTQYFPSHIRATSLGWGLGLGRVGAITGPILVGIIMTMQYDLVWNFTYSHLQVFLQLYLFSLFLQNKKSTNLLVLFSYTANNISRNNVFKLSISIPDPFSIPFTYC